MRLQQWARVDLEMPCVLIQGPKSLFPMRWEATESSGKEVATEYSTEE